MKGYLIEKGTQIKTIYADGKMFHCESSFPVVIPITIISAVSLDSIKTSYADVVEFYYVILERLKVVDMEDLQNIWEVLLGSARSRKNDVS